jgi:hypothetical protein
MDKAVSDKLLSQARFLGYDYISDDFSYSPVQGELTYRKPEYLSEPDSWIEEFGLTEAVADANKRLVQFSYLLNEYGLFDNEADLQSYVSIRSEIAEQTTGGTVGNVHYSYLETSVELWPCKTWALQGISV